MRKTIWDDRDDYLSNHHLDATRHNPRKLRIKAKDSKIRGSINVLWDRGTSMLRCDGISNYPNTPYELIGMFIGYLLEFSHFSKIGIRAVNIFPETI